MNKISVEGVKYLRRAQWKSISWIFLRKENIMEEFNQIKGSEFK